MATFLQLGKESINVVSYNKKMQLPHSAQGLCKFSLQHGPNSNVHDSKIWDLILPLISYEGTYFGQTT